MQEALMPRRPWMAESGPAAICDISIGAVHAGYAAILEIQQASGLTLKRDPGSRLEAAPTMRRRRIRVLWAFFRAGTAGPTATAPARPRSR